MPKFPLFRLLNLPWYLRLFEGQMWLDTAFNDDFTVMNSTSKLQGSLRYLWLYSDIPLLTDVLKHWLLSVFYNPLEIIFMFMVLWIV